MISFNLVFLTCPGCNAKVRILVSLSSVCKVPEKRMIPVLETLYAEVYALSFIPA